MTGTILEHVPKTGRKTFGYSLFLGRDENGKQQRQVRRGFPTKLEAAEVVMTIFDGKIVYRRPS